MRRNMNAIMSRLAKLGFEVTECGREICAIIKKKNSPFTRRQVEEIFKVADQYGARVRFFGKISVSKARGRSGEG